MTQRFISVCLVMTALVASTNAFASRARQQVLGTADPFGALSDGTHGSFYYDDNYNIFYNPAYVNDFKNWVAIEKSNGAGSAEGGFVYGMQNWAFGLFMNRGGAVAAGPGGAAGLTDVVTSGTNVGVGYTTARVTASRPIDAIFGYDLGAAKLGLGLTYGYFRAAAPKVAPADATSPNSDNQLQDLNVRVGAQVADFDPFFAIKVIGKDSTKATAAGNVTEVKNSSFTLGTKYHYGEWTPFAYWRRDQNTSTTANVTGETKLRTSTWGLGAGRSTKLGEGTNLDYALSYHRLSGSTPGNAATTNTAGHSVIPVDISVEHDMTSWLVARAGLGFRVWDQIQGVTNTDTTTGRLGLTAKVGKANIDWAIGGKTSSAGITSTGNVDSDSFDLANGFFSTASLTYAW